MKQLALIFSAMFFLNGCATTSTTRTKKPDSFNIRQEKTPENCGTIPAPMKDIASISYYSDANYSIIDPDKKAKHEAIKGQAESWNQLISYQADTYLKSGDKSSAKCALAHLDAWAYGDAGLGELVITNGDMQSWCIQKSITVFAASTYFKVMREASPEQAQRITWWLNENAKRVIEGHKKRFTTVNASPYNNHYPWAGAAVMQVAVINRDPQLLEFARGSFEKTLTSSLRPDGALTEELFRAGMALHYHNAVAFYMAYMTAMSKQFGEDWSTDERYQRMLNFIADANNDFSKIERITGISLKFPRTMRQEIIWIGFLNENDPRYVALKRHYVKNEPALDGGGQIYLLKQALDKKSN